MIGVYQEKIHLYTSGVSAVPVHDPVKYSACLDNRSFKDI